MGICLTVILSTLTDVFVPLFSGRLVDAVARGADNPSALRDALNVLGIILTLGLLNVVLRHVLAWLNNARTLRMMGEVVREAFHRVQRFSTDWHANSFAGSNVRKITRGMHALDLLSDTLLLALMPSAVLLIGASVVLSTRWPLMGLFVLLGSAIYVAVTLMLALLYMAPAARLANQWDTRMGGSLGDAMSCNAVVKAFGAEVREERRIGRVVDKWSARVERTWSRSANNTSTQNLMMLLFRGGIIGAAIWLWQTGEATAGEVTYVI
ncbi:MAG TPA: ABC transporter ATP-binding protein, partial [Myxococcaceae bacterium]|nr:ABC transporter ATP-binding protein [Myxococcaceae bacterium]